MQRKQSSRLCPWCACSVRAAWTRLFVVVQNGLGKAGGAGGEVDGGVVGIRQFNRRLTAGAVAHELVIPIGKIGAAAADVVVFADFGHPVPHRLHPVDELPPEHEQRRVREVDTVSDLLGCVAVIERDGQRAGFEGTEVNGQPFQAVHEKDGDLVALFYAVGHEEVGEAVGAPVKIFPRDLAPVGAVQIRLHQVEFLPVEFPALFVPGVYLYEGRLVSVELRVLFQKIRNWHERLPLPIKNCMPSP